MLIENSSKYYLKRTRAFSKEIEFNVPEDLQSKKDVNIEELFPLAIACIADLSADIVRGKIKVEQVKDYSEELYFSSKFYDAYLNINTIESEQNYFYLTGAISYYLCDQIGSSVVLARKIDFDSLNLSSYYLDRLLYLMLNNVPYIKDGPDINPDNRPIISQFIANYNRMMVQSIVVDFNWIACFRHEVYETVDVRNIFFVDALLAIFVLKSHHSIFNMLPQNSNISLATLTEIVPQNHFVRELWPAQRRMCELGLFNGKSGVVQMPTGAGKTKSVAMAIYSAFCSGNVRLSVVVAPFRALCREISVDLKQDLGFDDNIRITEISDLLQVDYFIEELFNPENKTVVVTTPEKFLYILRQDDSIVSKIGQLVFDEGHLFDDEERGATYELLISSILNVLNSNTQKILISAIIPNVEQINKWFTNDEGVAFHGRDMSTVDKLPAALKWEYFNGNNYCYLYYIDRDNKDSYDFYVPRMIEIQPIKRKKGERQHYFPSVDFSRGKMKETNDMAIACLLRLVASENVAVFCGNRLSANKILERIIYLNDREIDFSGLKVRANQDEVQRIANLLQKNYGTDSLLYKAGSLGVFAHHAGVADGIKTAVEYALRNADITNVICTSTLAQGVNLPIKHLIVSSIYQAGEKIKVRDFHNLIGRTARSGMFTEGTIIFSDPFVFQNSVNRWKWRQYKALLDPSNSEKCSSVLLDIVRTKELSDKKLHNFYTAAMLYYEDREKFDLGVDKLRKVYHNNNDVIEWFEHTFKVLSKIESYLAVLIANNQNSYSAEFVDEVLENTLAASLATEEEIIKLKNLFSKICEYLERVLPEESSKRNFSKSMISSDFFLYLQGELVFENLQDFDDEMLLDFVLRMVLKYGAHQKLSRIDNLQSIKNIARRWIKGESYSSIYNGAIDSGCQIMSRGRYIPVVLEDIALICDHDFGYSTSIIINSICEILLENETKENPCGDAVERLQKLSQNLKYGLSESIEIFLYELGFNDRVLAQEIAKEVGYCSKKKDVRTALRSKKEEIEKVLANYPSVFQNRLSAM